MKSLSRIPRRGITRPKGTFFEALDINAKSPPVSGHHLGSLISPPESEWATSPLSASSTVPRRAANSAGVPSAPAASPCSLSSSRPHYTSDLQTEREGVGKLSITRPVLETPPAVSPCCKHESQALPSAVHPVINVLLTTFSKLSLSCWAGRKSVLLSLGLFLTWFCELAWEGRLRQQQQLCLEGALLITGYHGRDASSAASGVGVLGWALLLWGPAMPLEEGRDCRCAGLSSPRMFSVSSFGHSFFSLLAFCLACPGCCNREP